MTESHLDAHYGCGDPFRFFAAMRNDCSGMILRHLI